MDKSCENCKYMVMLEGEEPCKECLQINGYIFWEPQSKPKIKAKLMNTDDPQFMPFRKREDDAGADLRARINEPFLLHPETNIKIPTGIALEILPGYMGDIRPRSGAAFEGKITISGTIDSNYRGEIHLNVTNDTDRTLTIEPMERLAQIVVIPYLACEFELVEELSESDRGSRGFGSSGKF